MTNGVTDFTTVMTDVSTPVKEESKSTGDEPKEQNLSRYSFVEKYRRGELTLFEEAAEATLASACVFALADIRAIAHKGIIPQEDAEEVLRLPVSLQNLRALTKKHKTQFDSCKSHDFIPRLETYLSQHEHHEPLQIHYVGDEHSTSECVHYIGRSQHRGAIVLTFRGSVTTNDWVQDLKLMITKVANPLRHIEGQPEEIGVHMGFKTFINYGEVPGSEHEANTVSRKLGVGPQLLTRLGKINFETSLSNKKEDKKTATNAGHNDCSGWSKLELVLSQLRNMKRQYPQDTIFICGHSLGGALALIAALAVCADPELNSLPLGAPEGMPPVSCFTVGNPKPGDGDFCLAMEHLERSRVLRCCVIHNTWDIVPMLATNVTRAHSGFWHPGWKILLYRDRCEIGRSREETSRIREEAENPSMACGCCRCCCCRRQNSKSMWNLPLGFDVLREARKNKRPDPRLNKHDHRVYLERLVSQERYFRTLNLEKLYDESGMRDVVLEPSSSVSVS